VGASAEAVLDTGWERFCRTWICSLAAGGIGAVGVALARGAATGGFKTDVASVVTLAAVGSFVSFTLATLTDAEAADVLAAAFGGDARLAVVACAAVAFAAASRLLGATFALLAALAAAPRVFIGVNAAPFSAERFAARLLVAVVDLRAVLAAVFAALFAAFFPVRAVLAFAAVFARADVVAALRCVATLMFAALPPPVFVPAPVFFAVLGEAPRDFEETAALRLRTVFLVDDIRGTLLDRPALETGQGLAQPASRLPGDSAARAPDL
jgi:hypothetical protein